MKEIYCILVIHLIYYYFVGVEVDFVKPFITILESASYNVCLAIINGRLSPNVNLTVDYYITIEFSKLFLHVLLEGYLLVYHE